MPGTRAAAPPDQYSRCCIQKLSSNGVPGEVLTVELAGPCGETSAELGRGQRLCDPLRERPRVAPRGEQDVLAVDEEPRGFLAPIGDDREAMGKCGGERRAPRGRAYASGMDVHF